MIVLPLRFQKNMINANIGNYKRLIFKKVINFNKSSC